MKGRPWKPGRLKKRPGEACESWCGTDQRSGRPGRRTWCTKKCRDDVEGRQRYVSRARRKASPEMLPRVVMLNGVRVPEWAADEMIIYEAEIVRAPKEERN